MRMNESHSLKPAKSRKVSELLSLIINSIDNSEHEFRETILSSGICSVNSFKI